MTAKEALEKIKTLFTDVPELKETEMMDGRKMKYEGELKVGTKCAIVNPEGAMMTIEDGEYELKDGRKLVITGGVIAEIKDKVEEDVMPEVEVEMSAMFTEIHNRLSSLQEENTSLKTKLEQIKSNFESFQSTVKEGFKVVEAIASAPVEAPIEKPKNIFSVDKEKNENKFLAMGDVIKNLQSN